MNCFHHNVEIQLATLEHCAASRSIMDDRRWTYHSMAASFTTFMVNVLVLHSIIRKKWILKRLHEGSEICKAPDCDENFQAKMLVVEFVDHQHFPFLQKQRNRPRHYYREIHSRIGKQGKARLYFRQGH